MRKKNVSGPIYAIGDIHGMFDELVKLMEMITADFTAQEKAGKATLVFLGDYIDRGPKSRQCVDFLMSTKNRIEGARHIFLKGNHEQMMLDHYAGDDRLSWHDNGGLEAEQSYKRGFVTKRHRHWLARRPLFYAAQDYFFVHAGVDPDLPLEDQPDAGLLWIRDRFLEHDKSYHYKDREVVVVHGHTPTDRPELKPNRIGVDTGAYYSGRLTAAVLDAGPVRFLST